MSTLAIDSEGWQTIRSASSVPLGFGENITISNDFMQASGFTPEGASVGTALGCIAFDCDNLAQSPRGADPPVWDLFYGVAYRLRFGVTK